MSFALPLTGSPLREMFDVRDLVAIGLGREAVPTVEVATRLTRTFLALNRQAQSLNLLAATEAHGDLVLVRIARAGVEPEVLWKFGPLDRHTKVVAL